MTLTLHYVCVSVHSDGPDALREDVRQASHAARSSAAPHAAPTSHSVAFAAAYCRFGAEPISSAEYVSLTLIVSESHATTSLNVMSSDNFGRTVQKDFVMTS
jgi:hypothetical protein